MSASNLALVTGGGSGIGAATARRLAGRGLHVVIVGRTAGRLQQVVSEIEAAGGTAEPVVADCGTEAGQAAILGAVGSRPVQAFVHAAGADRIRDFAETTRADFAELIGTNLGAAFFLTQGLLPVMTDRASVTFVGTVGTRRGMARHALYGASKAGLIGLVSNLAVELAPKVRVNCISPGSTDTGMLADYVEQSRAGLSEKEAQRRHIAASARILLRRIASADEVAATVAHVALDATAMTGVDLPVDVGYMAS